MSAWRQRRWSTIASSRSSRPGFTPSTSATAPVIGWPGATATRSTIQTPSLHSDATSSAQLEGEAGLPHPARPDERDQPAGLHELDELDHLVGPPDEPVGGTGQAVAFRRHRPQRWERLAAVVGSSDLVQLGGSVEVAQAVSADPLDVQSLDLAGGHDRLGRRDHLAPVAGAHDAAA